MDKNLIRAINRETSQFYIKHADEFSDTRQQPWAGWDKLAQIFSDHFDNPLKLKVLDIGCGNMRFEKYLESVFPNTKIECTAIDNCDMQNAFTLKNTQVDFYSTDIIESLLEEQNFVAETDFDLVVSFGLMHHIPDFVLRLKLIKFLINLTAPNGILAFSFWNYFNDKKLKAKAEKATKEAVDKFGINTLGSNDKFLAWSNDSSVYRFCHNFDDDEIDKIIKSTEDFGSIKLFDSYASDGKTNNLNRYLILKKI